MAVDLGDGRFLRVCDLCGGVDTDPRHTFGGPQPNVCSVRHRMTIKGVSAKLRLDKANVSPLSRTAFTISFGGDRNTELRAADTHTGREVESRT